MTYTLTAQQLLDLRFDLDLPPDPGVFTDAELQRAYDRGVGDYATAKMYLVNALLHSAAKLHDYKAAQSGESLGQVWDHLKWLYGELRADVGMGGAVISVGNFGLNIDATVDNISEWDGSELAGSLNDENG
jgi:hypothetical protein